MWEATRALASVVVLLSVPARLSGSSRPRRLDVEDLMTLTRRRAIALGSTACGLPSVARAETWPTGPVTILVAYAAGGGPDLNRRGLHRRRPVAPRRRCAVSKTR